MSCQLKGTLFIVTGTILWGASGVLSQHLFVDKIISAEWLVPQIRASKDIARVEKFPLVTKKKVPTIARKIENNSLKEGKR